MRISDWSSDVCSSDLDSAAEAYNGLGVAYAKLGRADLAERYFKMALSMDGTNPRFAANLDRFYNSPLGNSSRALAMRAKENEEEIGRASCRQRVCQYV